MENTSLEQLDSFLTARLPRQRNRILNRVQYRIEHGESIDQAAAAEYLAVVDRLPPGQVDHTLALYHRRHHSTPNHQAIPEPRNETK